jgi:lycopene cyclase domain-containing protein
MSGDTRPRMRRSASGAPTYARGAKWPAWFLLAIPFLLAMIPLFKAVWRRVDWLACAFTVLLFEGIMIVVEHNSVMRGHWVYNENRILGPLVWGVPIEEPLIYYLLPPIFVIMLFELLKGLMDGTIKFGAKRSASKGR